MSQSLVENFVHVIFSTKKREALITPDIEIALHKYLAATCLNLNCQAKRVGGHVDHVHLLCSISKNISISEFVKEVKEWSSKWMKSEHSKYNFYWQAGYAAFSVAKGDIESVVSYIDQQHAHHRKHTFQEEFRKLLASNDVAFDERYVWD
jgi:REP element-mobilizing transposase RayT